MEGSRRQNVLLTLLLAMIVGTSTIVALLIILGIGATRSELVSLFGPMAGALFAALAAIVAIEWQETKRVQRSTRIVTDLIGETFKHWKFYAAWIDDGQPPARRSEAAKRVAAFIEGIRATMAVAQDLRTTTPGMARLVLAIQYESKNLATAEREVVEPRGDIGSEACKTALGKTVTVVLAFRQLLEGAPIKG